MDLWKFTDKGQLEKLLKKFEQMENGEEYLKVSFIYFLLCLLIILCMMLGIPKKCRKKIIEWYPNLEELLETSEER